MAFEAIAAMPDAKILHNAEKRKVVRLRLPRAGVVAVKVGHTRSYLRHEHACMVTCRGQGVMPILNGDDDDTGVIVMPCVMDAAEVRPMTLRQFVANGLVSSSPSTEPLTTKLLLDVGTALARVHALGLVHRDIKMDNVMVQGDDGALLTDFGWCMPVTAEGQVGGGTPGYMSPEQCCFQPGRTRIGPETDVWAFGIMAVLAWKGVVGKDNMRILLTLQDVHRNGDPVDLAVQLRHAVFGSLVGYRVPSVFELAIVEQCLEPFADRRPTMAKVCDLLTGLLNHVERPPSTAQETLVYVDNVMCKSSCVGSSWVDGAATATKIMHAGSRRVMCESGGDVLAAFRLAVAFGARQVLVLTHTIVSSHQVVHEVMEGDVIIMDCEHCVMPRDKLLEKLEVYRPRCIVAVTDDEGVEWPGWTSVLPEVVSHVDAEGMIMVDQGTGDIAAAAKARRTIVDMIQMGRRLEIAQGAGDGGRSYWACVRELRNPMVRSRMVWLVTNLSRAQSTWAADVLGWAMSGAMVLTHVLDLVVNANVALKFAMQLWFLALHTWKMGHCDHPVFSRAVVELADLLAVRLSAWTSGGVNIYLHDDV